MRANTIIILLIVLILAIPQQAFSLRPTSHITSKRNENWKRYWDRKVDLTNPDHQILDMRYLDIVLENMTEGARILTIGEKANLQYIGGLFYLDQFSKKCESILATSFGRGVVEYLDVESKKFGYGDRLDVRQLNTYMDFDLPREFDVVISHLSLGMRSTDQQLLDILERIKETLVENDESRLVFQVRSTDDYFYGQGEQIDTDVFVKIDPITGLEYIRHFWTEESVRSILQQAGFAVEEIIPYEQRVDIAFEDFSLLTIVASPSLNDYPTKNLAAGRAIKAMMPPLEPPMLGAKPVSPAKSISVQSAIKRSV